MGVQLSPGVAISEVDLTTIVPSVSSTAGAYAGYFRWGPVNKPILIPNEISLVNTFGKPDANTTVDSGISFFSAANFLAYGNTLYVSRAANNTSYNASANTSSNIQIKNKDDFQYTYLNNTTNANVAGPFIARYPGALGSSLAVQIIDSGNTSWSYSTSFTSNPGTSAYASSVGGSNDEVHVVVIDEDGLFTGTKGTILETFGFLSKAVDATINGASNYWKQVIFDQSKYIYAIDPPSYSSTSATWGKSAAGTSFATLSTVIDYSFGGGTDVAITDADLQNAYSKFVNKEEIDISLVITGNASVTTQQYVIDNIANSRADCVAFISPRYADVVNQSGSESSNITNWLASLSRSSSYVVADSGWKYQFDRYNNKYRWIPLNADVAGLCVYTDTIADPWYSPAGLNRGAIKNVVKLAWNPNKTFRDSLYSVGVNPVVSFPGNGTVLFGDKTLQAKPSAFDRINVRRLFIVLEKAISTAAKYSLFEFNDEYTRSQFNAIVTPFLREVQGRRGVTDFKVVCDSTNNTPAVIDANQFVGDIYIKPARSINYIQLNFVAVATGVNFNTIIGQA